MQAAEGAAAAAPSGQALGNGFGPALVRESVPEFASGAWQLLACELRSSRRQRRKRIVTYAVRYRDGLAGPVREEPVVVKLYGSDRGAAALRNLQALWGAGFRPPSPYQVPRPYGYSRRCGALLQGLAAGTPWADSLHGGEQRLLRAARRSADWLLALEGAEVEAPPRDPAEPLEDVRRFAGELGEAFPEHHDRLLRLAERLGDRLRGNSAPRVPSHGDFHPKNVFLGETAATVIDFDTFGRREAGYDAGYAIGQLLVMSRFRLGSFEAGARAASAFFARYAERGLAGWERVAAHAGRTLVQSLHFELCTLRNGRIELLPLWPAVAQELLEGDGPGTLESLIRLG